MAPVFLFYPSALLQGQTIIHGKLLSVDGSPLPASVISIVQVNQRDIFSGYEDVLPDESGTFELQLNEPGLYRITFTGIYHHSVVVPFLIIDQDTIEMDVALLPFYFNDGAYFAEEDYLSWIRVVGNFNNYDFNTGYPFTLNGDGSISAFIPADRDTIRYQVRGLTYGRGPVSVPLPLADEYNIRENRTIESVVHNSLPGDTLEIRYKPGSTIPHKRHIPENYEALNSAIMAFIHFQNAENRYWVEPIASIHGFQKQFVIADFEVKSGVSVEKQLRYQEENVFHFNITETIAESMEKYSDMSRRGDLHPQQQAMYTMAYAFLANRIESRRRMIQQFKGEPVNAQQAADLESLYRELKLIDSIDIDYQIILQIPERVSPAHPVWSRAYGVPQLILMAGEEADDVTDYLRNVVAHHPDESVVRHFITAYIQEQSENYSTFEDMPLYDIILNRFGQGDVLRHAIQLFVRLRES